MKKLTFVFTFFLSSISLASQPVSCEHDKEDILIALVEYKSSINIEDDIERISINVDAAQLLDLYYVGLYPPFVKDKGELILQVGCELPHNGCGAKFISCKVPLTSVGGDCETKAVDC